MLTLVVKPAAANKPKKAKVASAREIAKDMILRKDATSGIVLPVKPQGQPAADPAPKIPAKAETPFTPDELVQLDLLFDIVSWTICLFSGNVEELNKLGETLKFGSLDAQKAAEVRAKLRNTVAGLTDKVGALLDKAEPIEASAVSDIQNEIKAAI